MGAAGRISGRLPENWIRREAKKADPNQDQVILENPDTVRELDDLLRNTYIPFLHETLKKTDFPYDLFEREPSFESEWIGPDLGRKLSFRLYDPVFFPIFFGGFTRSKTGFLISRKFVLGLPESTDPSFLLRILGDDRFSANSPALTIEPSPIHPEWNAHYCITLSAGDGISFGAWTLHNVAKERLQSAINNAVEMYEHSMIEGFQTMEEVEEFLDIAVKSFEAR